MKKSLILLLSVLLVISSVLSFSVNAETDKNLILDKEYTLEKLAQTDNAYPKKTTVDNNYSLTDGITYSDYNDFVKLYRGVYNIMTVDLGKDCYVSGFSARFYSKVSWGIYAPRDVKLLVSDDKSEWHLLAEVLNDNIIYESKTDKVVTISKNADRSCKARYVSIWFTGDVDVYTDEIEVIGTETAPAVFDNVSDITLFDDGSTDEFTEINDRLSGVSDIVLIYTGASYDGQAGYAGGFVSKEQFIPYVSHVNSDGISDDIMFDSILFIPLYPGSGSKYAFDRQTGWEYYLENVIGKGTNTNMEALDSAVAEVKTTLSLDGDYKYNVFITVPFSSVSTKTFGKAGTSKNITLGTDEDCKTVIDWYIDLAISKFNEAGYSNLNLAGFYWYDEIIEYSNTQYAEAIVKNYNETVHEKGYASIWIPYYCAAGAIKWKELGFDYACLQVGYAFPKDNDSETGDPKSETCNDAMTFAKKYGLGVEMEISSSATDRFNSYIKYAKKVGFMENGIRMYYQESGPGVFYTQSLPKNGAQREIYENTYLLITEKYEVASPAVTVADTIYIKADYNRNKGYITVVDEDTQKSKLKITGLVKPTHGTLSLEGDGFFLFIPDSGFVGEDYFTFAVTDGFNTSENYTVKLCVVEDAVRVSESNVTLKSGKTVMYNDGETTGTVKSDFDIYEIAVDKDGKIVSVSSDGNLSIPKDGFVISAGGESAEELKSISDNKTFALVDSVTSVAYFYNSNEENKSEDEMSIVSDLVSEPSVDNSSSSIIFVLIIAGAVIIIAVVSVLLIKNKISKEKKQ